MESSTVQVLEKEALADTADIYEQLLICVGLPVYFCLPCKLGVLGGRKTVSIHLFLQAFSLVFEHSSTQMLPDPYLFPLEWSWGGFAGNICSSQGGAAAALCRLPPRAPAKRYLLWTPCRGVFLGHSCHCGAIYSPSVRIRSQQSVVRIPCSVSKVTCDTSSLPTALSWGCWQSDVCLVGNSWGLKIHVSEPVHVPLLFWERWDAWIFKIKSVLELEALKNCY